MNGLPYLNREVGPDQPQQTLPSNLTYCFLNFFQRHGSTTTWKTRHFLVFFIKHRNNLFNKWLQEVVILKYAPCCKTIWFLMLKIKKLSLWDMAVSTSSYCHTVARNSWRKTCMVITRMRIAYSWFKNRWKLRNCLEILMISHSSRPFESLYKAEGFK